MMSAICRLLQCMQHAKALQALQRPSWRSLCSMSLWGCEHGFAWIVVQGWSNLAVEIWTHARGGVTHNDFILAAKFNAVPKDDLL